MIVQCTPSGRNLIAPIYIEIIKLLYSRENPMIVQCTPSDRTLIAPYYSEILKLLYSRMNPMIVHHQVEI